VLKIIGGAVKNINEDLKYLPSSLAFIWVGKRISKVKTRLGRVVDILEASGAFDPGSNPGRGVSF
jgi:glutamine cyclotransferase